MKINIIGGPGGGKTTLAKKLSEELGISVIHSDSILHKYRKEIKQSGKPDPDFNIPHNNTEVV